MLEAVEEVLEAVEEGLEGVDGVLEVVEEELGKELLVLAEINSPTALCVESVTLKKAVLLMGSVPPVL